MDRQAILEGYGALGRRPPTMASLRLIHSLRPLSTAEQISDQIAEGIVRGETPEGVWLRESTVAERFKVSRGPVREAFRLLESDGILTLHANRGAQVRQLSRDELWQVAFISNQLAEPAHMVAVERMDASERGALLAAAMRISDKVGTYSAFDLAIEIVILGLVTDRLGIGVKLENLTRQVFRPTLRYTVLGLREDEDRKDAALRLVEYGKAMLSGDARLSASLWLSAVGSVHRRAIKRHYESLAN